LVRASDIIQGNNDVKHSRKFDSIQTGGNPIRRRIRENSASKDIIEECIVEGWWTMRPKFALGPFFDDDIEKHGRHNLKTESGDQEHYASVAAGTRVQRTQLRR